jgi:hypothetical protein
MSAITNFVNDDVRFSIIASSFLVICTIIIYKSFKYQGTSQFKFGNSILLLPVIVINLYFIVFYLANIITMWSLKLEKLA